MVCLNVIKKDGESIIVYNSIAYNKIFWDLLYFYISSEQKLSLYTDKKGFIGSDL